MKCPPCHGMCNQGDACPNRPEADPWAWVDTDTTRGRIVVLGAFLASALFSVGVFAVMACLIWSEQCLK